MSFTTPTPCDDVLACIAEQLAELTSSHVLLSTFGSMNKYWRDHIIHKYRRERILSLPCNTVYHPYPSFLLQSCLALRVPCAVSRFTPIFTQVALERLEHLEILCDLTDESPGQQLSTHIVVNETFAALRTAKFRCSGEVALKLARCPNLQGFRYDSTGTMELTVENCSRLQAIMGSQKGKLLMSAKGCPSLFHVDTTSEGSASIHLEESGGPGVSLVVQNSFSGDCQTNLRNLTAGHVDVKEQGHGASCVMRSVSTPAVEGTGQLRSCIQGELNVGALILRPAEDGVSEPEWRTSMFSVGGFWVTSGSFHPFEMSQSVP